MSEERMSGTRGETDDLFLMDDTEEDTQANKFLLSNLGSESYGIGIEHVTDIIEMQKITAVPDMPAFVRGVINLRGKVIPAIDLRLRFGMVERAYDDRTCIVIVNIGGNSMGLIVDTVSEVLEIPKENVDPPPAFRKSGEKERYIAGLGKVGSEVKILLDIERIVSHEELEKMTG